MGYSYPPFINDWFTRFLGAPCSLIRTPLNPTRVAGGRAHRATTMRSSPATNNNNNDNTTATSTHSSEPPSSCPWNGNASIAYSNESQFLFVSESSVEDVNQRVQQQQQSNNNKKTITATTITPRSFRPNFVVRGGTAYQEDQWKQVTIADQQFTVNCPPLYLLLSHYTINVIINSHRSRDAAIVVG